MGTVASRALRNNTRDLLRRVEHGERVTITVDGRPVAVLEPLETRPRWLARADFVSLVLAKAADPGLAGDLDLLAPDWTDELPD
ncbi:MAG: type II toxin-antitoxin system prevent-host-death family antitoxin [Chloroflexota bacterium]|nr:type II toxin-antitoxin system prevent-host-death family antitoxin [Chloroflexota bacterium]